MVAEIHPNEFRHRANMSHGSLKPRTAEICAQHPPTCSGHSCSRFLSRRSGQRGSPGRLSTAGGICGCIFSRLVLTRASPDKLMSWNCPAARHLAWPADDAGWSPGCRDGGKHISHRTSRAGPTKSSHVYRPTTLGQKEEVFPRQDLPHSHPLITSAIPPTPPAVVSKVTNRRERALKPKCHSSRAYAYAAYCSNSRTHGSGSGSC